MALNPNFGAANNKIQSESFHIVYGICVMEIMCRVTGNHSFSLHFVWDNLGENSIALLCYRITIEKVCLFG